MGSNVSVRVETKRLDAILNRLGDKANAVLDLGAAHVQERWQKYIVEKDVVDTGAYLNSIHTFKADVFERTVADGVDYGIYQELGTTKKAARPCATPALEDERKDFNVAWEAIFR